MRTIVPVNAVLIPKDAHRVFHGILYDTYQWEQKRFDGSTAIFEMLKRPDTVKVIAVHNEMLVILEQKQPSQPSFFDIPGGRHDHDEESELQAAKRELLEETGLTFKNWKLLEMVQPNRRIEQIIYTFLATDLLSVVEQKLDPGEDITVHFMDFDKAKKVLSSAEGRFLPPAIASAASIQELLRYPERQ